MINERPGPEPGLGIDRISHLLCRVHDLPAAVSDYRDLGFDVAWGAAPGQAHNALIWFEQGPFIELFTTARLPVAARWMIAARHGRGIVRRLDRWATSVGWCDLALDTKASTREQPTLAAVVRGLRRTGVPVTAPITRERTRPDGLMVRWQLAAPHSPGLPFLMSAYDPPQRPSKITHPNGARHITRIELDLAPDDRTAWHHLLGGEHPAIQLSPAATTRLVRVTVTGPAKPLNPAQLHGAALVVAQTPP